MAQKRIFNSKKRRVLRKRIPFLENLSGLLLLCGLTITAIWFMTQQGNFNPEERDISLEQLLQSSNDLELYTPPLKPWVEPGTLQVAASPNLGLFPETILDQEWKISSRLKQFDVDNLFEKINGEAEKFIKQGFQSLNYIALQTQEGSNEIAIELYDQGDMGGSMGIFSDHLSEDKFIEQNESVVYFMTPAGAIGRKGRFFFRIAGNQTTEKIRDKSIQLVAVFSQLEENELEIPKEFQILNDRMEIPLKLISYQKRNVFQYDFVEDFWFGRLDLQTPTRIFIHEAASLEEANILFEDIIAEQSYEYQIVEENESQVVMFHEFLKNYFVITQKDTFIFGIENLGDQQQISRIMRRVTMGFEDG